MNTTTGYHVYDTTGALRHNVNDLDEATRLCGVEPACVRIQPRQYCAVCECDVTEKHLLPCECEETES